MNGNAKLFLGILGGVVLGAVGASVIRKGKLRPLATKALSYGIQAKDVVVAQVETLKEDCEDLTAEARHEAEVRKADAKA